MMDEVQLEWSKQQFTYHAFDGIAPLALAEPNRSCSPHLTTDLLAAMVRSE
jgi:hypothetical protein